MQPEHAEHTLETIRTLMERSQRYEHISGFSGLIAGLATLAGGALLQVGWLPFSARVSFVVVWTSVFAVAFGAHCCSTFLRARRRDEPICSRQARTVLWAVLPCFLAGLALSVAFGRREELDRLPALWLVLYGCGALATGFFAPQSITRLGIVCLTLGILAILFLPAAPTLTMIVGFGLTHLGFGICVIVAEHRDAREQRFWQAIDRLAATDEVT